MCRNIKKLRRPKGTPTDHELHDAALQFVRKISGYHTPSEVNRQTLETAVREVASATRTMFRSLHVRPVSRRVGIVKSHTHDV